MRSFRLEDQKDLHVIDEYVSSLEDLHDGQSFHAKQQEVIDAIFHKGKKRIFCRKGRKGGGTQTLLYPAIRIAKCFPNSSCYIIGPQLKLQNEILWDSGRIKKMIPPKWGCEYYESESRIYFPNGSFIKVEGANNYDTMVGIEGDYFGFDEFKDHDPRAYKNCYPNLAARDGVLMVCGAPPESKHNYYYTLEQEALQDPSWSCHHWTIWDNTFLPGGRDWILGEKAKYFARGDWDEWENLYEARYVFGGKRTVIPSFREEKHVYPLELLMELVDKDKDKLRWYTVCDPGFSTCFAVLFAVVNPYTSEVFLLNEIYETDRDKLSVSQIWPRIREIEERLYSHGNWRRIYDSAAPGFPQEVKSLWKSERLGFRPTYKEDGDETKFFRIINSIFHMGLCKVSSHCLKTIWEIANYVTKPPRDSGVITGREASIYPDENNHQLDNFRYLIKGDNYRYVEKPPDVNILRPDGFSARAIDTELTDNPKQQDWGKLIMDMDPTNFLDDDGDRLWQ